MPSIPSVGESTVCEINREYLTRKDDADRHAESEYSKILGQIFPVIPFDVKQAEENGKDAIPDDIPGREVKDFTPSNSDLIPHSNEGGLFTLLADGKLGSISKQIIAARNLFSGSLSSLFRHKGSAGDVTNVQALSWHKHKLFLAFIANRDQVFALDFEEKSKDPYVLAGDSQKGVEAIAWRPNAGATLAVACKGGICIWAASYPGSIAPVRSGMISFLGTSSKPTGARWVLVDYFRYNGQFPITTLSWSPCGKLLATACKEDSSFLVWDVALGESTPLRRGLGGISLLSWSPTGDYLLSCNMNGIFHIWETNTWTSEPWSSTGSYVVSAMWSPDARVLLCAFNQTTTLGALHFAGRPPSLDVHLLPLELPEIDAITGGEGSIEKMAWDGTGERLAVSYTGGDGINAGLLAIYDTRQAPILTASLLGFVRGPGVAAKPLAFAFHSKLRQGALLAVCWSTGYCCIYPMLFRTY
ncbi:hypothetical protein O6H91_05G053400 [Diphasiastrum complanatum]|uniref:Uncharacterized protein n=1 Tax=Diphasiastrum complanatum TaxID=34168 RepID=A0ACC2DNA2_DIPCM|nr:hypothetical protein O6H91_05G053400 [Diphasiastrum complanatum]